MENSSPVNEGKFGFGFNDIDFSDRVLRLEIISSPSNTNSGVEKYLNWFSSIYHRYSQCDSTTGFKVQTLHVNSLILAAKSPFFYKLFKNGMRESQPRNDVTLRINASEEAALMDLLNFMYGNPLKATSARELLDVLMAADKFEVTTCTRHCAQMLLKLPMSLESALSYLELSSSVFVGDVFKQLLDAAKQHIAGHYINFSECQQKEAMSMPLSTLEVVLGCDGLKVKSEDDVFEFILKWVRVNYPKLEERREILTKHLTRYICFQHMSGLKLKEVVECPDFDYEQVSKLILNALIFNVLESTKCGFPRRVYKYRPVKVVQLEFVRPHCVVYLDLTKEECADLYPSKRLYSEEFCVGGRVFSLVAQCDKKEPNFVHHFCLYVYMKGSENCTLDFAFAVMKKPTMEFQIEFTQKCSLANKGKAMGVWLFNWTDLMKDESVYFINGILHLQAQITINT